MGQEYLCIAARTELLRECDGQGRLLLMPITAHDDLILSCCPYQWTPAARVVGEAMGRGDPRNPFGDMVVASRLQHLIATGLLDVEGQRRTLRDYRVRRPPAGSATAPHWPAVIGCVYPARAATGKQQMQSLPR
jgi:hypothetical protein